MLTVLDIVLPMALSLFVSWSIFEETLPGERQFWITRPYSRLQLLASKALFCFLLVNIPIFISDCCILGTQGFPVLSVFPRLLLRQLIVTAIYILPSFAIAAITSGVRQFLLAWFMLLIFLLVESALVRGHSAMVSFVSPNYLLAMIGAVAVMTIVAAYFFRRINLARGLALGAIIILPLLLTGNTVQAPQHKAFSVNASTIQISYDLTRASQAAALTPSGDFSLRLPLAVLALRPGELLRGNTRKRIQVSGRDWPQYNQMFYGSVERINNNTYWQRVGVTHLQVTSLVKMRASIRTTFDLRIVNDKPAFTLNLSDNFFSVPSVGRCRALFKKEDGGFITCRSGLDGAVETDAYIDSASGTFLGTFQPQSIAWGLSPVTDSATFRDDIARNSKVVFVPRRPIGTLERSASAENVDLGKFTSAGNSLSGSFRPPF